MAKVEAKAKKQDELDLIGFGLFCFTWRCLFACRPLSQKPSNALRRSSRTYQQQNRSGPGRFLLKTSSFCWFGRGSGLLKVHS